MSLDLDTDLIHNCINGKREAQFTLYNRYADAMYNVCCRMVTNQVEAQEILQDSFFTIFNKLHLYNFQSSVGAWIKKIVINKCIDHLRLKKVKFDEINDNTLSLPQTDEQPPSINVKVIQDAIDTLPAGYKMVFVLYAIEGYDHEEISHILHISEQTSKSQYHRAKEQLKKKIIADGQLGNLYNA